MVGTEYRIVTALDRAKEIWKGDAFCVHMTHREVADNGNSIVFVVGHSYGLPKPHACITVGVSKIPNEIIMEKDHTLWLGEYSKLPSKDILWKSKPQKEEVKC